MFIVGPVHIRDNGPGCSGAEPEPVARQTEGEGHIHMPIQEESIYISRGASTPTKHWKPSGRTERF